MTDQSSAGPDGAAPSSPARSARHYVGLETLRAIAALAVVFHHAASLSASNPDRPLMQLAAVGDSGVAVFFVLSGFLIYLPFARHALNDTVLPRWRTFWWRRALRILPAYWLVLTFFWVFGSYSLGPRWWRFYLLVQIYDPADAFNGLTVAWSLATEISFYLVVPFVALALQRLGRHHGRDARARLQLAGCAVLFALAYVSRFAVERVAPGYVGVSFQWLPMNADLFATGMALAVLAASADARPALADRFDGLTARAWVWWAAAGALFAGYAFVIGPTTFEVGYTGWYWQRRELFLAVVALLLMAPMVFGAARGGRLRAAWQWGPAVWVGVVSYGLYLWHQEWMEWAAGRADLRWLPDPAPGPHPLAYFLAAGLGLGLASAAASWYGLEKPLARWRNLFAKA